MNLISVPRCLNFWTFWNYHCVNGRGSVHRPVYVSNHHCVNGRGSVHRPVCVSNYHCVNGRGSVHRPVYVSNYHCVNGRGSVHRPVYVSNFVEARCMELQPANTLSRFTVVTERWPNCTAFKDKDVMKLTKQMGQPYMSRPVQADFWVAPTRTSDRKPSVALQPRPRQLKPDLHRQTYILQTKAALKNNRS
jgi:hypothetical protein